MNQSVQSTNPTNDNRTTIIITETSKKTFLYYYLPIRNMLQSNFSKEIFFRKGVIIELFIDYEHRCLASCKLHNNFLQISCCEFEYFSMNKPYTSRRRQRNKRTKSQNELAWIYSAFMKISTPQQSTYPWEVFSEDLFAIFQAIHRGNCTWFNLPRLKAPFIWGTLFGSVNLN